MVTASPSLLLSRAAGVTSTRVTDKDGATLDCFSERCNAKAAKRFLGAALKRSRD